MNIDTNNTTKLEAVISATTGRATAHTHTAANIQRTTAKAIARLQRLAIPKKDWHRYEILTLSGDTLPRAYTYKVKRTHARIAFTKSGLPRLKSLKIGEYYQSAEPFEMLHAPTPEALAQITVAARREACTL